MDKEKSDMKFSDMMSGEASGIEKFKHTEKTLDKACGLSDEDSKRTFEFFKTLTPPQSKAFEAILTTDKLHNTLERIYVAYRLGDMVGSQEAMKVGAEVFAKILGLGDRDKD